MPTSVNAVAGAMVSPDPARYAAATATQSTNQSSSLAPSSPSSLSQLPSNTLDKDTFLKLLVAQLKYQDPMKPSTSEEFIATTAQFTVVEKLDELTKQGAATALVASLTTASSLVGRTVTAIQNGVSIDAAVQRSRLVSGEVVLETDKGVVRLNEIVSIGPPALSPAGSQPAGNPPATDPPNTGSQGNASLRTIQPTIPTQENQR